MNNVILLGRLTDVPETRITSDENATSITRFSLAVADRTHKNASNNYDTDFIKCVCFNKLSDVVSQYTTKGSQVLVTGRLHTYSYKKDDRNVYMSEVILERVEFISDCKQSEIPEIPEDDSLPFK